MRLQLKPEVPNTVDLVLERHTLDGPVFLGIADPDGVIPVGGYLLSFHPDGHVEARSGATMADMFELDNDRRLVIKEG